jgi:hypothetical protein
VGADRLRRSPIWILPLPVSLTCMVPQQRGRITARSSLLRPAARLGPPASGPAARAAFRVLKRPGACIPCVFTACKRRDFVLKQLRLIYWCPHKLVSAPLGVSTNWCPRRSVSARIGVSTNWCQHELVTLVSARIGVSTTRCQHHSVSARNGVSTTRCATAPRGVSTTRCQHKLVSAPRGVSTNWCQHRSVSARIGVSTNWCQHHSVSARIGVSTTRCQHELVSAPIGVRLRLAFEMAFEL